MCITINNLEFFKTCEFCPEQYDVNLVGDKTIIAYVRLRWGYLTVRMPDWGGEIIYEHNFKEEFKGAFDSKKERRKYLKIINEVILEELGE